MEYAVHSHLHSIHCKLESAPPQHQQQNGLVERNWRSVIFMVQSWINSAPLPSLFWYHTVKRAVKVSNYLPVKLNVQTTAPFELIHRENPDLYNLISLFSIAYIDLPTGGGCCKKISKVNLSGLWLLDVASSQICLSLTDHPPNISTPPHYTA